MLLMLASGLASAQTFNFTCETISINGPDFHDIDGYIWEKVIAYTLDPTPQRREVYYNCDLELAYWYSYVEHPVAYNNDFVFLYGPPSLFPPQLEGVRDKYNVDGLTVPQALDSMLVWAKEVSHKAYFEPFGGDPRDVDELTFSGFTFEKINVDQASLFFYSDDLDLTIYVNQLDYDCNTPRNLIYFDGDQFSSQNTPNAINRVDNTGSIQRTMIGAGRGIKSLVDNPFSRLSYNTEIAGNTYYFTRSVNPSDERSVTYSNSETGLSYMYFENGVNSLDYYIHFKRIDAVNWEQLIKTKDISTAHDTFFNHLKDLDSYGDPFWEEGTTGHTIVVNDVLYTRISSDGPGDTGNDQVFRSEETGLNLHFRSDDGGIQCHVFYGNTTNEAFRVHQINHGSQGYDGIVAIMNKVAEAEDRNWDGNIAISQTHGATQSYFKSFAVEGRHNTQTWSRIYVGGQQDVWGITNINYSGGQNISFVTIDADEIGREFEPGTRVVLFK